MTRHETRLTVPQCATLACLLEATAPKPGNVHRSADFEDLSFVDLQLSAVAIGPAMERAVGRPLGETILDAVRATRAMVGTNSNLGLILLLAPLAAVPESADLDCADLDFSGLDFADLEAGVEIVLKSLGPDDARGVYEAIRLARPGGMGEVDRMDVAGDAPVDLLSAMRAAADRDLIARQYCEGFRQVFQCSAAWIEQSARDGMSLIDAIVHAHVRMMARFPDSLIARKCGSETAGHAAELAQTAVDAVSRGYSAYQRALGDLDFWLRSDGHRRNPGTTADLIGAGLFVLLRAGRLRPPLGGPVT